MHLNTGVPKKLLVLTLAFVFCTGCGPGQSKVERQVQEMRSLYQTLEELESTGTVTADYEDKVYTYSVTITGNAEAGRMTVTEPENISGTIIAWSDGALKLSVEDVTLETGPLSDSGFSPADAVPALLKGCAEGALISCGEDDWEGQTLLYAEFQSPTEESCTVAGWFDPESYALRRAEIAEDGRVVISMVLESFSMTLDSTQAK